MPASQQDTCHQHCFGTGAWTANIRAERNGTILCPLKLDRLQVGLLLSSCWRMWVFSFLFGKATSSWKLLELMLEDAMPQLQVERVCK